MSAATAKGFDIIDIEVHSKSIRNMANEMAITLMRTSGSPVVTEALDFSTCIVDRDAEQLAFAGFVTFHISTAIGGVKAVLRGHPLEDLRPGDGFLCNDPHSSGAIHQGDLGVVMPFFHDGEVVAFGYVNEHVLDAGGSAVSGFAPGAHDNYSEALNFNAVRVIRNYRIEPEWESFIGNNVRLQRIVLNDIRSMIAANSAGERRLKSLLDDIGFDRFAELNAAAKDLSEKAMRDVIRRIPDGTYESEDWVEWDARGPLELFNVRCRLLIADDHMTIQYRGDKQTDAFINGAWPAVVGQSWSALLSQLAYDIPVNAGLWRPITFDLGPAGSIVNSLPPAPVTQLRALRRRCTEVGAMLIFDEVQCGVGRTGAPFAANRAGVTPDVITAAKALGAGFPVSAMLLSPAIAARLSIEDMGTTFGGGPLACTIVETVIDIIESEGLLENVNRMAALIRSSCIVGPVTAIQGAGLLLGLRTTRPAKEIQKELLAAGIFAGTAADPNIVRLLPPFTLEEPHVAQLAETLGRLPS